ncbi:MAG: hypothetical protein II534_04425, partial [Clostridia bacterium]|nr:hypothetical protein [Clostridia bacterium]
ITNCTNEGSVTHTGSKSSMIGGIIAYQQGQSLVIENCVNTGTVSTAIGTAGGILGRFGGDNDYNPEGIRTVTIKNCLNTGAVTGTTYVGGILGHARSAKVVIESCTNKGEIKAVYDNAEKKSGGKNDAGGIFGSTGSDNSTSTAAATKWYPCDLFIRKCINEGNVTCENGRAAGILSYSWCGGRNGGYPHSEVTDCVNKGTITAGSFASQILAYTNDTKAMEGGAPQPTQIKNCVGLGKLQRSATAAREEAKYYPVIFGLSSSKYATNYDVLLTIVENDGLGWYAYSEGTEANRVPLANAPADKLFIKSAAEAEAAAKALGQIGYVAPQSTNPSQPTGDTAVWVLVIAGVSLLGMGIALKARKA